MSTTSFAPSHVQGAGPPAPLLILPGIRGHPKCCCFNFSPLHPQDATHLRCAPLYRLHLPQSSQPLGPNDTITIVVISRLFYNKGTDLSDRFYPPNPRFSSKRAFHHRRLWSKGAIDLEQNARPSLHDRVTPSGPLCVMKKFAMSWFEVTYICIPSSFCTEAFGTVP